ncbi:hypothetical protein LWI29_017657 [Acer saccharum]|uniref:Uncharacterized protein n=1 Tax=Acer saccharum TaxID=4024 RepID=A0AA39S3J3_ACESA|nr:hypothetical protein LWI29_017657 [Acer saccharum]
MQVVVDEMETLRQLLEVTATPKVVAMMGVVEETETLRQLLEVTEALLRIDDEPRPRSVFDDFQQIILLCNAGGGRGDRDTAATPRSDGNSSGCGNTGGGRGDGDAVATPRSD